MGDQLESIVQKMIDAGESEENIASVIREFKAEDSAPMVTEASVGTGPSALAMGAAKTAAPAFLRSVESFATSPTAAKTTGAIARGLTTVGALGHGAMTGNLSEIFAAPLAGWQAGKGGYWLGKGAQSLAAPVARGMSAAAPYASAVAAPLSMAAGVGELAQMAEPGRNDIGFSVGPQRSAEEQAAHPALLNFLISKLTGK